MKQRDTGATTALRSALGAIDNAEAVPARETGPLVDGPIAGAVSGLGTTEADRRALGEHEMEQIVQDEIASRLRAAADYERLGEDVRAARLRDEAAALARLVDPAAGDRHGLTSRTRP